MASGFWEQVVADGRQVPRDRPLDELTADLTRMLGSTDPEVREAIAVPTLTAWVRAGVYDDLLRGLGDGMCAGLQIGLGREEDDSVFRRASSARVLAECVDRDTAADLVDADQVLTWGDRVAAWLVRERDLRGAVPDRGWARAVAHGADALGALVRSPRMGRTELVVLLDVLADRVLQSGDTPLDAGEDDRLAAACLHALRRDLVGLEVLEPWVARLAGAAVPAALPEPTPGLGPEEHRFRVAGNAQAFLRSLHLQLALSPARPAVHADLLLVLVDQLRATNRSLLQG